MSEGNKLLEKAERSIKKAIFNSDYFKNFIEGFIIPEVAEELKRLAKSRKMSLGDFTNVLKEAKQINSTFKKFRSPKIPKTPSTSTTSISQTEQESSESGFVQKSDSPQASELLTSGTTKGHSSEILDSQNSENTKRRNRSIKDYEYEMLSDFDKRIFDLSEGFGGGVLGRDRAYDVVFKNLPFLKPIAKALPAVARPLSRISAHPIASMGAGLMAIQSIDNKMVSAAKSATSKEIHVAVSGAPSKELMDIAAAIGETESIYQRRSKMMSAFGDADYGYRTIGTALKGADDLSRVKIMEVFGIDETDAFIAMQMAIPPEQRVMSDAQKRTRAQELVRLETEYGLSGHGGIGAAIQSVLNLLPGGSWARRKDFENFDYVREFVEEQVKEYNEKTKEAGEAAREASSLPLQSATSPEPSSSQSEVSLAFNIGTVDVSAENPEQLIDQLMDATRAKDNYAYALAFDSGRAA